MFSPDLYEFVKLLIEKEVEYLIVGGYAVGIHVIRAIQGI